MRFLIVVFDGLRGDFVTPDLMPALAAFGEQAAVYANARAQFPSVTRVNKVSFATGARPGEHGVWANEMYLPQAFSHALVDLGKMEAIRAADAAMGRLIAMPTLGEYLALAGKRYAAIHTGSSGAAGLIGYRAAENGQLCYSFAGRDYTTPATLHDDVAACLGSQPGFRRPNSDRLNYAFDLFTHIIKLRYAPEVAVIWLNEPDKSFHLDGLSGTASRQAIGDLDHLFARIYRWWLDRAEAEDLHLIVASDHGHAHQCAKLDVGRHFRAAGFELESEPTPDRLYLQQGDPCALYIPSGNEGLLERVVSWLQQQDWCGHIFCDESTFASNSLAGTFPHRVSLADHPRVPALLFTLAGNDRANEGWSGQRYSAGAGESHGTSHGGLSRSEMHSVLMLAGRAFKAGRFHQPAGLVDIVPTILHLLGLSTVDEASGRVLVEALGGNAPDIRYETLVAENGDYRQTLRRAVVAGSTYVLDGDNPGATQDLSFPAVPQGEKA